MARKFIKIIPPKEIRLDPEKELEHKARQPIMRSKDFQTVCEQVAKSSVFFKNWYVPEIREKYQNFDKMKRIDKAFPYAQIVEGKSTELLLVDEPKTESDIEICAFKAKILKELGYRYIFLEKDSTLYDALEQLGEV